MFRMRVRLHTFLYVENLVLLLGSLSDNMFYGCILVVP